jgi:hypothetical protein
MFSGQRYITEAHCTSGNPDNVSLQAIADFFTKADH